MEAAATPAGREGLDRPETDRADGVFEGGGVKGVAFAGALQAAEQAGVREWVNVAGTSAGAISAALLVAGYDAAGLRRALDATEYFRFADYGFGGKWVGGLRNALRSRGVVRGGYFKTWLSERFAESPLAKERPTFADVARTDLPADLDPAERERARHRLKVVASDITEGRMLVLPDDIEGYAPSADADPFTKDAFPLVDAVRMSMSFPFFFDPVTLWRVTDAGPRRPHLIVDGGLLSNFPIWIFDSASAVTRRTFGFRLYEGQGPEQPPYREVRGPLWPVPLAKAMFFAATEAWDRRKMSEMTRVRTVNIPTGAVSTLDFQLSRENRDLLFGNGKAAAEHFFATQTEYLNSHGRRAAGPAAAGGAPPPAP